MNCISMRPLDFAKIERHLEFFGKVYAYIFLGGNKFETDVHIADKLQTREEARKRIEGIFNY